MSDDIPWPTYLVDRAIAPAPVDCSVVDGSTPVVAFGNPVSARVATLGINPSCNEFLNRGGALLGGKKRRLVTRESLELEDQVPLTTNHGREILEGCASYFGPNSYHWFRPLNHILTESIGASYGETACHLDLVQWATNPVWRDLDVAARATLLDEGVRFLTQQLRTENYRLILVNGRTALRVVEDAGIVTWQPSGIALHEPSTELVVGDNGPQRFLGWSCNIQSQPGARRHIGALIAFVKEHAGFSLMANPEHNGGVPQ